MQNKLSNKKILNTYYTSGVFDTRYKNHKTCHKTLQKITDRLLQQKFKIYAKNNDQN